MKTGDKIPSLSLRDKDGNQFQLNKFKGIKPLVIYFYPKNFTPGCTKEACEFRDRYQDFKELGAEVIGISSDSESSHAEFIEKYSLPFVFLSDKNKEARKAFGVKPSFLGLLPGRETFVFDKNGFLSMRYRDVNTSQHANRALQKVRALQGKM